MPRPPTPQADDDEQLERFKLQQKWKQAQAEAKETAYLRRATKQMRKEVAELLSKPDLKAKDINPSLVLRRLLYVGFSRADAPALSALKNLNDLVKMKGKVSDDDKGEEDNGVPEGLLD